MTKAVLSPSKNCTTIIKQFEKLRTKAYKPTPNDVWTIGYGHTNGVKPGDACTPQEADQHLALDMLEATKAVNELVTVPLKQNQFDALISFVFNIGRTRFAASTMLKILNTQNYTEAGNQFPRWKYQKGKELAGLVKRRAAERALFEEK